MKYYVIAPDSSGSKGDEAMVRGVLNILHGQEIVILTTPNPSYAWQAELLDRCGEFEEIMVPFNDISRGILSKGTLIVLGADVLDGTCGIDPAMSRLYAMKKMNELGGEVYAFCSFRSNVQPEILRMIKCLGVSVHWFLREELSCNNFFRNTGIKAEFFPDFAYYCETFETDYVIAVKEKLASLKETGRKIIAVNFAQTSFDSFFKENDNVSRRKYVMETLNIVEDKLKNPFFILIAHDIRTYKNSWSDCQFQELAASMLDEDNCISLRRDITYPELLTILPEFDCVVSGRMHLAVAALRSGCVPVIYTGTGEKGRYTMVEKCRGMMKNRIGDETFVATDRAELVTALQLIEQKQEDLKIILKKQNVINRKKEADLCVQLKKKMAIMQEYKMQTETTKGEQAQTTFLALRTMSRNIFSSLETKMNDTDSKLCGVLNELKDGEKRNIMLENILMKQQAQIANLYTQINCLKDLLDLSEQRIQRIKQEIHMDKEY